MDTFCRRVFVGEGCLNTVSALILILFPKFSLDQMGYLNHDVAHEYILQQLGSIILILGYIGLRSPVCIQTIEALLLGDIVYVVVFIPFVNEYGAWTAASHFSVWSVTFLALVRTMFIIKEYTKKKVA